MARQFSQIPPAATGGDMGWVHEGQLAPELNTALTKMALGQRVTTHPLHRRLLHLGLRARQEPLGTKIADAPTEAPTSPDGTLPLARLLLPLGASAHQGNA